MLNKPLATAIGAMLSLTSPSIAQQGSVGCILKDRYAPAADASVHQRPHRKFHENSSSHFYACYPVDPYTFEIKGEGPAGVGMEITQDRSGHFIVQRLEAQGPAEKSKVLPGDRILKINGTQIYGLHMYEVVKLVRGDVRSKVKLELENAKRKRTVTITRMYMAPSNFVQTATTSEQFQNSPQN